MPLSGPEKASKIRIAYVLTPITFGGAEKVSLNFLRTVDRNRFDIHVAILTRPWDDESYFSCEIRQLGYDYETIPVAYKPDGDFLRIPRVVWRLRSLLKNGVFSFAHTHGYFADICGQLAARMIGLKGVSTCHGFITNDKKLQIYNRLDMYALRLCQTVIAVSEGIKAELINSGIKESRISVIQNSVNSALSERELQDRRIETRQSLCIAPDEYVVGYLGRLSKEKGLNFLVEAASELRFAGVPVRLLIVGDGQERSALEQLSRDRGIENLTIFTGFQKDIENWLPAFDVFTLTSLTEGTPMALLEAMSMGVPVIATAVGGVPNVVTDGVNGLLVPAGDYKALANKIQMLKDNKVLKGNLVAEGLNSIKEKFGIHSWCRKIETLYDGIHR